MKHNGGRAIREQLEHLDLPARKPTVRAMHEEVIGYIRNNEHRMDYPRYLAKGWQIGSGSVESACQTVVGKRLKGSGMRWGESGTDSVCHLRALYKREPSQWTSFWSRSFN